MDDNLEHPDVVSKPIPGENRAPEDDEQSSADEDEGPDWTKLPTVARPIIPKRGEKDFEPKTSGGSGLQRHVLDRARSAMVDALKATRTTSCKTISYAVWHPDIARAHVTVARGIHFTNMGHSVARIASSNLEEVIKAPKRLELLPEETLYLVERGAMFCWKESELTKSASPEHEGMEGVPMTVQQAFSEMIGRDSLSLEKYQVYSYLKRLGYVVTRTNPPSEAYPKAAPFDMPVVASGGFLTRCFEALTSPLRRLFAMLRFDWWKPIGLNHWLPRSCTYPSLFKSLRFLPSGRDVTFNVQRSVEPSPYQIFFNLYKPSTPFKKTAPPAPDFSVVVVDARKTPMPTLTELHDLFGVLPQLPPPVPKRRMAHAPNPSVPNKESKPSANLSFIQRFVPWMCPTTPAPVPRKPNPFAILKAGKKMVVVAVVDAGTISFFRFGQGAFEDFPMS